MATSATPAPAKAKEPGVYERFKLYYLIGIVLVSYLMTLLPFGLSAEAQTTLGLFVFVILMWVFEILPLGLASVIFGVLLVVILGEKVMPPKIVFAGFTNSTIWLLLGAFLLGEATTKTGLAQRVALYCIKQGGSSYKKVILYLWVAGAILGLLTPSGIVRVAMFIPIMAGIVEAYKAKKESNFTANLLLHIYWGSVLGTIMWYTGGAINVIAMGVVKSVTGYGPSFWTWFIWCIIPSITLFIGTYLIIEWVMPIEKELIVGEGSKSVIEAKIKEIGPMSAAEMRASVFFVLAIVLWMTEQWHHINTAWVAMGVGAALFLPKIGVLEKKSINNVSWDIMLLLGVTLGIDGIMRQVGLDTWIIQVLLDPILGTMAAWGSMGLALGVTIFTTVTHFLIASATAEIAVVTPLVAKYAQSAGLNATLASMTVARTAQNVLIFPYQSIPLIVLWGTGYLNMRKCVISMGAVSIYLFIWNIFMAPYWDWIMTVVK